MSSLADKFSDAFTEEELEAIEDAAREARGVDAMELHELLSELPKEDEGGDNPDAKRVASDPRSCETCDGEVALLENVVECPECGGGDD